MGGRTPDSCFIRTEYPKGRRTPCSNAIRTGYPNGGRTGYPKGIRTEYPNVGRIEALCITEIFHDDSYLPCTQVAALLEGH